MEEIGITVTLNVNAIISWLQSFYECHESIKIFWGATKNERKIILRILSFSPWADTFFWLPSGGKT